MSTQINPTSTLIFDVSPSLMENLCTIIDSGDGNLGWRGLASRILPSWLEMRNTERLETAGKSPTREMLWTWAQQNKTVDDLVWVLQEMQHHRAVALLRSKGRRPISSVGYGSFSARNEYPSPQESRKGVCKDGCGELTFYQDHHLNRSPREETKTEVMTYTDVIAGTKNFHQSLKIGAGLFSEVYKGVKGKQTFAVKLFKQETREKANRAVQKNVTKDSWRKQWNRFRTEMEVLHLYQHPNILDLWGCFSEGDRYCLVYPYFPNGSLFHRLHFQDAGAPLTWQARVDILTGTTKAVVHLHTAQPCSLVCANITSANILLDGDLQPKLCDFGMAHLRPHSVSKSCSVTMDTRPHSNLGYLPEEYIRDGRLSVKLDVYSLGVVMMETLTGQRVLQESPKRTLLRDVLHETVEESGSLDACLRCLDPSAGHWPHTLSLGLFRLALDCTAGRPKSRPDIDSVLRVLGEWLPPPCPPEDQPRTLDDRAAAQSSLPVEDDEMCSAASNQSPGPCECSQSEVTFLSRESHGQASRASGAQAGGSQSGQGPVDLYGSWPVQCSCTAEVGGPHCNDCRVNGFALSQPDSPTGDTTSQSNTRVMVENSAKARFRGKIQIYNKGMLNTDELFSVERD